MLLRFLITVALICSSFAQDEANTTTSTTTTTTPSTTTTTTTSTTTTTVPPVVNYSYYNVTNPDTKGECIMLDGKMKFKVEYSIADKNNTTEIEVPKPSNMVDVKGSCKGPNGTQYISIAWGANYSSSLNLVFTEAKDGKTWTIKSVISVLKIDAENFPNATDVGSSLTSNITLELKPSEVPVNKSYKCYSNTEFNNITTTENGSPYNYTVSLHFSGMQIQAFNKLNNKDKFVEEIHCDADKVADIVPIAVGCALAGLIIIVAIAYIIGRRRRSASYQSV